MRATTRRARDLALAVHEPANREEWLAATLLQAATATRAFCTGNFAPLRFWTKPKDWAPAAALPTDLTGLSRQRRRAIERRWVKESRA